jgi:V8-like Glu-specific endopeptidase
MMVLVLAASPLFSSVKVGEEVKQRFETGHPYKTGKGVVWQQEFHSPNAGYIAVHFASFDLAKNDYVEISSPDGKYIYTYDDKGKKVKKNRARLSTFWATHIPGDTAIVKLISRNSKNAHGIVIDKWVKGYARSFISAVMSNMEEDARSTMQSICSGDDKEWAKCYDGTDIYNSSKAVCRLLINGNIACTGWLLGSEGHVVTNNHCIDTQSDADNTDYEFMAEGSNCSTDCSGWGSCSGVVEANAGTLVKTDWDLDYSLILLPVNVTGTYGYLQLRNTLPTIGERIYVPQHPSAMGKQIAVNSDVSGPYATIYSTNQTACHGGPGDIGYFADTGGGSSGAPVIAYSDNLVVALHHCANCPNRGVPIPSIISHMGSSLPADAVAGGGPVQYCAAYAKNQNYEWMSRVQAGNLDNSTNPTAYSDFTHKSLTANAGASVSVALTPGFSSRSYLEYWKIWIDYNGDGDFSDAGEEVFSGSGTSTVSGNFVLSSSAGGNLRMRVAVRYGDWPVACNTFTYGEIEDYTVAVQ